MRGKKGAVASGVGWGVEKITLVSVDTFKIMAIAIRNNLIQLRHAVLTERFMLQTPSKLE